jgi:hypothetical protein
VTRIPPPDSDDEDAIAAYIAEVWRASEAGELLEELPWSEVEGMDEIFDELSAQRRRFSREEAAAAAQRRRERRRRRAWRTPLTDA